MDRLPESKSVLGKVAHGGFVSDGDEYCHECVEANRKGEVMRPLWINALTHETDRLLAQQPGKIFHLMSREFESTLIRCALLVTGGCRINAANLLGIGRNTITRKIHKFGLDNTNATSSHGVSKSQPRSRQNE